MPGAAYALLLKIVLKVQQGEVQLSCSSSSQLDGDGKCSSGTGAGSEQCQTPTPAPLLQGWLSAARTAAVLMLLPGNRGLPGPRGPASKTGTGKGIPLYSPAWAWIKTKRVFSRMINKCVARGTWQLSWSFYACLLLRDFFGGKKNRRKKKKMKPTKKNVSSNTVSQFSKTNPTHNNKKLRHKKLHFSTISI